MKKSNSFISLRGLALVVCFLSVLLFANGALGEGLIVGSVRIDGAPQSIFVAGGYAYVPVGSGLARVDVHDPTSPSVERYFEMEGTTIGVYASESYAYVTTNTWCYIGLTPPVYCSGIDGLHIIDLNDLDSPLEASITVSFARDPYVVDTYAYVTSLYGSLSVIDISDSQNPTISGSYESSNNLTDLFISDSRAYLATTRGLEILDIGNPAQPTLIGSADGKNEGSKDLYVYGSYAYVTNWDKNGLLSILDIHDPDQITSIGSVETIGWPYSPVVSSTYAYVIDHYNSDIGWIHAVDVSTPSDPQLMYSIEINGSPVDLSVNEPYMYVVYDELLLPGLLVLDTREISTLAMSINKQSVLLTLGVQDSNEVFVTNGVPPYSFEISDPSIIDVNLTGHILTVLPQKAGRCVVTVRDSDSHSVTLEVTIMAPRWVFQAQSYVESSPALDHEGTVYATSLGGSLHAIHPDGTSKWTYAAGERMFASPCIGPDGTVYGVGADSGTVYALDSDGKEKWRFEIGEEVLSSPAVDGEGTLYIGSDSGNLHALRSDGTKKWTYETGPEYSMMTSSPAIAPNGTIYVGVSDIYSWDISTSNSYLYAIRSDGTLQWRSRTEDDIDSSPAVALDGTVYVGSSKHLYAIRSDGSLKWRFGITNYSWSSSPAIGSDGTVYVGSSDHYLYAVRPDGTLKWKFKAEDWIKSSPAVGLDGTVYVGSLDHSLYAIRSDGTLKWRFPTGDQVWSSPIIGPEGTIYFGSNDHKVYAVDGDSGGPATSAWPMYRHDAQHTGLAHGVCDQSLHHAEDGLWKSEGGEMNFYVQTYVNGSAVIIATADLRDLDVFLDPDIEDGIDVSDYAARGLHLCMGFTGGSWGAASLTVSGSTKTYPISKTFAIPEAPQNHGIWKTPSCAAATMSYYIQTYDAGSAIVIGTADLEEFYAFLDPDFSDGISVDELSGKPYHLTVNLDSGEGGMERMERCFEAPFATSPASQKAWVEMSGTTPPDVTNDLGMTFAYVAPGTYAMGSPLTEAGRQTDETQHQVTVTKGFYFQTSEVTVAQFRQFIQKSGYLTEAEQNGWCWTWDGQQWNQEQGADWDNPGFSQSDTQPVTCVSWNDASAFAQWLSQEEDSTYRLPYEAEWEYASRAGSLTAFANGDIVETRCEVDANLDVMAWYCGNSQSKTHAVESKAPNAWGLYDMHGNVHEWCQDWYGAYPSAPETDPIGPGVGSDRIVRGGSWPDFAWLCRSAFRNKLVPEYRYNNLGIRMVREYK